MTSSGIEYVETPLWANVLKESEKVEGKLFLGRMHDLPKKIKKGKEGPSKYLEKFEKKTDFNQK